MIFSIGTNFIGGVAGYAFIIVVLSASLLLGIWKRRAITTAMNVVVEPSYYLKLIMSFLLFLVSLGLAGLVIRMIPGIPVYIPIMGALVLFALGMTDLWNRTRKEE